MLDDRPARTGLVVVTTALMLALAAVPLVATSTLAAPTPLGVNLVRNPGAEAGAGTNGYSSVAIPAWVTSPQFTVVRYGAPEFPTKSESNRIAGGRKFFSCGPSTDYGSAHQDIVIKGRAGPIGAGLIRVKLRARLAGYLNGADLGQVIVTFFNAGGNSIGSLATTLTAGTFGLFQLKKAAMIVPAGARMMRVLLEGDRAEDGGAYCDAYFDKVVVSLHVVN